MLVPFVTALPSFLRDTKDMVQRLHEIITVTQQIRLASLDVESLYTDISHQLGIKEVRHFLDTKGIQYKQHKEFIIQLLLFLLTHKYFIFNGRFYNQIRGTAMGTTCTLNNTNKSFGWSEDIIVFSDEYVAYTSHISFWGRYFDNVLILWEGDEPLFSDCPLFIKNTEFLGSVDYTHFGGQDTN